MFESIMQNPFLLKNYKQTDSMACWDMQGGQVKKMRIKNAIKVTATTGILWVTCTKQNQDYVLRPGQSAVFRHPLVWGSSDVVVQALEESKVRVEKWGINT